MSIVEKSPQLGGIEDGRRYAPCETVTAGANFLPALSDLAIAGAAAPELEQHTKETQEADRSNEVFRVRRDPETYEVFVESDLTLEDCQNETEPEEWEQLVQWAEPMRGKTVAFVNPTMEGGGVAIMRPALTHRLRLLGVDAHWFVMEGPGPNAPASENPFLFTKKMHNVIQRRSDEHINDDPAGKALHPRWNAENAEVLEQQPAIVNADVIVIDDPQPVPLIPPFKAVNPGAKIVWRNHIDNDATLMDDPATPQGEVWQYLLKRGVAEVDACVFHPDIYDKFVPSTVRGRTFLAPATIELRDDLNRDLSSEEKVQGIADMNLEIAQENTELARDGRYDDMQELIDTERDRVVLIARFDESKGMDKATDFGVLVRERTMQKRLARGLPEKEPNQIIIIGNGSVDDPSGIPMLEKMREQRRSYPEDVRKDIILKRLKHNYMAMNAMMYNDSEEAAMVAMQMSDAEGCETRITDWIRHGIPTVVANRGGMPLQIIEGKSGMVLDFDKPDLDFERAADYVSELMVNKELYEATRESTRIAYKEYNEKEYVTRANMVRWLRVFHHVLNNLPADKLWKLEDIPAGPNLAIAA